MRGCMIPHRAAKGNAAAVAMTANHRRRRDRARLRAERVSRLLLRGPRSSTAAMKALQVRGEARHCRLVASELLGGGLVAGEHRARDLQRDVRLGETARVRRVDAL